MTQQGGQLTWETLQSLEGCIEKESLTRVTQCFHLNPKSENTADFDGKDPWHLQKTFSVLQHMCQFHLNQYDWFVRAVDDAYVKVDQLLEHLSQLDKNKMVYKGFRTHPLNSIERDALGGAKYCYGGPTILLSRPLLKGLCPHLPSCRLYRDMPGDVALAKCIKQYLGMECQQSESFYHSYEDKYFHLLEDLVDQSNAFTLHPVKLPWLMKTLHHRHTKGRLSHLTDKLRDLIAAKYGITEILRNEFNVSTSTHDDLELQADDVTTKEYPVTTFTSTSHILRSDVCSPSVQTDSKTRSELRQVIRLANSSAFLGDHLRCLDLVNGISFPSSDSITYDIHLLCSPLGKTGHYEAISVQLKRKLKRPRIKKIKKVTLPSKLVFIVSAKLEDRNLMSFLMMLRDIVSINPNQYSVHVVLESAYKKSKGRSSPISKHPQETANSKFSTIDLKAWYRSKNIDFEIYNMMDHANKTITYHAVFMAVQQKYPASSVLITKVNVRFNEDFLMRCRSIVRANRRMYRPLPGRNVFPRYTSDVYSTQEAFNVMWDNTHRPVCIHTMDLHQLIDDPSMALQYKSAVVPGAFSSVNPKSHHQKQLKVLSSYDPSLQIN